MKAVQFDNPGEPSVLYIGKVPIPELKSRLKSREVLLQVLKLQE